MRKIIGVLAMLLVISNVFAEGAFDTNLKYGSKGDKVTEMQEFLIDQGYLKTTANGSFYSMTLKAVKAFQKANKLSANGLWNLATRNKAIQIFGVTETMIVATSSQTIATSTPNINPVQQIQIVAPVKSDREIYIENLTKQYDLKINALQAQLLEYSSLYQNDDWVNSIIKQMFPVNNYYDHSLTNTEMKTKIVDIITKNKAYLYQTDFDPRNPAIVRNFMSKFGNDIQVQIDQLKNEKERKLLELK